MVYLLSRLEPKFNPSDKENSLYKIQVYKEFSSKVLKWYDNERDSRQLKQQLICSLITIEIVIERKMSNEDY